MAGRSLLPRPSARRVILLAVLTLLVPPAALAARILYLARDARLCDAAETICVDGTLRYDVNSRLLRLRGRIAFAPGPGRLDIWLRGNNRLGHVRYAPMEIDVRGRASEIIDFRMIPDYPDVANWQIERIEFVRAGAGSGQ